MTWPGRYAAPPTSPARDAWAVELGRDHHRIELDGMILEVPAPATPEPGRIVAHHRSAVRATRLGELVSHVYVTLPYASTRIVFRVSPERRPTMSHTIAHRPNVKIVSSRCRMWFGRLPDAITA